MPIDKGRIVPVLVAVVALVTLGIMLVLGLALTHNLNATSTPLAVTVLGMIGTIVSVLLLAFQASKNAEGVQQVQQLVNGHMAQHTELAEAITSKLPSPAPESAPGPGQMP
jgi:hypothetical protein